MDLNLVKLVITSTPAASVKLTPLVTGKGAVFDDALRKVCCTQGYGSCLDCLSRQHCAVPVLTGQELSKNPELVRRHQKPALPYIFKSISPHSAQPGDVRLTLLGTAHSQLPTILAAVAYVAGGKHCFTSIAALDYQDTGIKFDLTDYTGISTMPVLSADALVAQQSHRFTNCSHVQLLLQSPLRIVKDMRELNRFDPVVFCRAVMRRISSLIGYYGEFVDDPDLFRSMTERCREVKLVKKSDGTSCLNSFLRGVTGCYDLIGPFDELGPLLYLGSLLHVGKRASYGLGAFDITPIS